MIEQFLAYSVCATEKKQKTFLRYLFGDKLLFTALVYSGSIHGWRAKDFHYRCNERGPTITLLKIKNGDCIGGYTQAQWSSPNIDYLAPDRYAMVFNLSCERYFLNKEVGKEIWIRRDNGPVFGRAELGAWKEPFNAKKSCWSNANHASYQIPIDKDGKNMLTNLEDGFFTITEMEVWEVTEKIPK